MPTDVRNGFAIPSVESRHQRGSVSHSLRVKLAENQRFSAHQAAKPLIVRFIFQRP